MLTVARRALSDTLSQAGSWIGILWLFVPPLLAVALRGFLFGQDQMLAEIPPLIAGMASLGITTFVLFAYNLIAAPYRIARERADAAQKSADDLRLVNDLLEQKIAALENSRPEFAVEFQQLFFNGAPLALEPKFAIIMILRIANVGTKKSALKNWLISIDVGRERIRLKNQRLGNLEVLDIDGANAKYSDDDALYEKATLPIDPGSMISGVMWAASPNPRVGALQGSDVIVLEFDDIYGNHYENHHSLRDEAFDRGISYYPGMRGGPLWPDKTNQTEK